ncbi:MAG: hypothetical protein R3344_13520 [Acidobacteriota bacterium]|nr:hypothetical protein [Acidobacteriota bacterium]
MPDNVSRRGAADLGMPLMILAFVVIGGFMFWLNAQAAEERAARAVVEDEPTEDVTDSGTPTVMPADIQMDASPYEGQEIRLGATNVASLLGTQGFWLEMPNGNPFLVSMSPELMAEGVSVAPGETALVEGTMLAMNDSTLTAWTDAGTIGENDRIVVEFATHYIEATAVRTGG